MRRPAGDRAADQHDAPSKRLRVAVFLLGDESFGIETFVLNELAHAGAYGIDFEYVCLEQGAIYESLCKAGATVTLIGGRMPHQDLKFGLQHLWIWLRRPNCFRTAYREVLEYLQFRRPDAACSHAYYTHVLCGLVKSRVHCPMIGQFHKIHRTGPLLGLQRALACALYAWAFDRVFTVSAASRDSMWGPVRHKTSVIHSGVDIESIRRSAEGVTKQRGRLVLVGRIDVLKKQDLAIRAVRLLADEHIECVLDLVGGPPAESDPYYLRLRSLVGELGLEDRVVFSGVLSPPYRRIASSEILVNCSTQEAFGLVIVEAMACGTPVVAAEGGGPGELLVDGQTGLYFEPGNPAALAAALKRLLADANLRSRLAKGAYEDAKQRFDMSTHMKELRKQLLRCCFKGGH